MMGEEHNGKETIANSKKRNTTTTDDHHRMHKSMDLSSRSCHSRSSHRSGKRSSGNNPSLDILKIGSTSTNNKKSSSQSLGSYTDKKSMTSTSLTQSIHSHNFRKPAFQGNSSFSKPTAASNNASNFDPFNEDDEEDLNDDRDDSEIDSNPPSKPSSLIDLLDLPSEHHPNNNNPSHEAAENASFGSVDSRGISRRWKGTSSSSSHTRRSTGSKNKRASSRKNTKSKEATSERSTRKSRTIDDGASKRASRTIGRAKSDSLAATKGSPHGKRKMGKAGVSRSKSMDEGGFDFDTPSFGFGGSNVFKETAAKATVSSKEVGHRSPPKAANPPKSNTVDFFDVAATAWEGDTDHNASTPTKLAPSKKEKRPPKILENEASEEEDFFPDAPPLAIGAGMIKGPTRLNSTDSGGNGGAAANRKNRNAAVSAMSGWMQEMPGFMVQPAPAPAEEEEESDDDAGFELQLPGSGGDISPLTAYTRKPVVLGRRR